MRTFTKTHNELAWLFPKVTKYHNPEQTFDEFEQIGQDLLEDAYDEQETFTRDDMMDAFMKGASVMNQILGERIAMDKSIEQEIATIRNIGNDFIEKVTIMETKQKCIKWMEDYVDRRKDQSHASIYATILEDFREAINNDDDD